MIKIMKLNRVRRKIDHKFPTRWPKLEERTLCKAIIPTATTPKPERNMILKLDNLHLLTWAQRNKAWFEWCWQLFECGFGYCLTISSYADRLIHFDLEIAISPCPLQREFRCRWPRWSEMDRDRQAIVKGLIRWYLLPACVSPPGGRAGEFRLTC